MGLFERFPYTNFHDLNLDWILNEIRTMEKTFNDFVSINALKYADPIQWNITTQYEKNTIVIDPLTGTAYISVQPVPSGIALTNTDYWTVVFDLGSFVVRAAKNFTDRFEEDTTLTATFPSSVNDWLIWGDVLYRVTAPIIAGDQYVIGSNIVHFTAEDIIGHIQDLNTTDKSNLVAAINEVLQTLTDTCGDLDNLTTTDKSNLVAAINEVLQTISIKINNTKIANVIEYGAVGDGVTDDTQAFNDAMAAADVVYVPKGSYVITGAFTIGAGKTILGEGKNISTLITTSTIYLSDNSSLRKITVNNTGSQINVRIQNKTGATVDDIKITGSGYDYGLSLYSDTDFNINHVEIENANIDGLSIDSSSNSILTKINSHNNGRYGFVIGNSSDIIVSNSEIHDNTLTGLVCVNSSRLSLTANIYNDNGYHGVQFNGCKTCIYSSSIASGNSYSGYDIYNSMSCKMIGCQSYDNGTIGVEIDTTAFNNVVSGSSIRLNGSCGITVYRSPRNIIIGNDIVDNGQRGDLSGEGFSATPAGVWVHDDGTGLSRETMIIGNNIGDDQSTHTQIYGVQIEAGPTEIMLVNNDFYTNVTAAVIRASKSQFNTEKFNIGYIPPEEGSGLLTANPYDANITALSGGNFYDSNDGLCYALMCTNNLTVTCNSINLTAYTPTNFATLVDPHGTPRTGLQGIIATNAIITDGNGTTNETVRITEDTSGNLAIISDNAHTGVTQIIIQTFNIVLPSSLIV